MKKIGSIAEKIYFGVGAAAMGLLAVLVIYSRRSIRANGLQPRHWVMWSVFLVAVGVTGFFEWLVQRHGNWYVFCYTVMSLCSLTIALDIYFMYPSVCARKKRRRA